MYIYMCQVVVDDRELRTGTKEDPCPEAISITKITVHISCNDNSKTLFLRF